MTNEKYDPNDHRASLIRLLKQPHWNTFDTEAFKLLTKRLGYISKERQEYYLKNWRNVIM